MAVKTAEKNKYILRRHIRLLSSYPGMKDHKQAIQYFIILHNLIELEELFYDQCMIADCQLNAHLNLMEDVRFTATVLQFYRVLYDPNHRVRHAAENILLVDDVTLYVQANEDVYRKVFKNLIFDFQKELINS